MFKNIKESVKQLAQSAVAIAEKTLGSSKGQEKKKMAVEYVVSKLPFSPILKGFMAVILSGFIDDSIEFAVAYMNSLKEKTNGEIYE